MKRYFTKEDISRIKRNTNNNNHGQNYEFIAHKIKSKTESQFKKINKKTEQLDHLPYGLSQKRYKLYEELMEELKRKSQNEYDAIYNIL